MSTPYAGSAEDHDIIAAIAASVESLLKEKIGDQSQLLDRNPVIDTYTGSFFLRFPALFLPGQEANVLVKIRRHPKMQSLHAAISRQELHIKMPLEFAALIETFEFYGKRTDGLKAILPFAYLTEYQALVMEQFDGETLRQLLMDKSTHRNKIDGEQSIRNAAYKTGEWLREFHYAMNKPSIIAYSKNMFSVETEPYFNKMQACGINESVIHTVKTSFEKLFREIEGCDVEICRSHEDFTTDNVLFNTSNELVAIDIKIEELPAYRNLALMMVHADTYKCQFLTFGKYIPPARIVAFRNNVRNGYFVGRKANDPLLHYYCALGILEKWLMYETIKFNHKGFKSILSSLVMPQLRHHFLKQVQHYLNAGSAS